MKLIVGLGNPGKEYEGTRHNAGFMVVEALALKLHATSYKPQAKLNAEVARAGEILLVKPQTYMNRSGETVQKVMQFFKIAPADLLVVHDDLDIALGDYKINLGIGPKVHNGINSIREAIGKDFWYVRVGTDNRTIEERKVLSGEAYVLMKFKEEEQERIQQVVEQVANELISRHL
jgi:peptidyl-tRNA hydrolase, PTH1 family